MRFNIIPGEFDDEMTPAPPDPKPRPCGMSQEAYYKFIRQDEGREERLEAAYQKKVAAREAREAREAEAAKAAAAQPPSQSQPRVQSRPGERKVTKSSTTQGTPTGPAKGDFLAALKKKDGTWRLQLFAFENSKGSKVPVIRFQLWESGEGGHPIKDGPGCGFSLTLEEARTVVTALKDGLARVKSGAFNPNVENNYLPRRK